MSVSVDSGGGGGGDRFPQWSVQETRDFLMIRAELDPTFMETKRNKVLWEVISTKMKERGYNRSGEQCKSKWKNLVTRYKMTTSSTNNSVFKGFFEKQKLVGPNFIDWYRQLRIVLSIEDKLHYLEQPIPLVSVAPEEQELLQTTRDFHSCKQEEEKSVSSYVLKMKGYIDNLERLGHPVTLGLGVSLILIGLRKEYDGFVQNYNMHRMGKIVNELHAILKLHEQTLTLPKSNAPTLHAIRAGKVQKGNKHKKSHSQMATRGQNNGKGKHKQDFAPKPKIPLPPKRENPAKDFICHECGEIRHWKRNCPQYLAELIKKKKNAASGAGGSGIFVIELNTILIRSWIYDAGCGTHIFNTTQGLRASRKLKPGALSLYVGNGQREAVEAIGVFYLCLPSGLEIVLKNCHYAPSITRGVISVSRLCEDGFVNRFVDNTIQVSKNNMVYFSAVPRDDIFEIDLSNSLTNESYIYAVSNKRAKVDLDSALLWHCRLGHVSKKCIEKLQHDELLNSSDLRAFEKYVSCMSGKMARKPYTHQVERAKDLLGLIHTDVCGPFNIMLRQGASYFVTFTDDFSRHGYVYLLKHNHEMFETFKVFQKEVENQLGYPKEKMGYSFYYPPENKVLVARNAEFLENNLIDQEASGSLEDLEIIQEEDTHPSLDTSLNHEEDVLEIDEPQSDIVPIRRSTRTRHTPDQSEKWLNALNVEMHSMKDNEVWVLVELPPNEKTVGRIDYEETFSPVADIRAIRILIAIAAYYDYEIWQMDVKTTFLNGYLNKEVYMEQPEGFVNPKYPNHVCKLKRSIYGLKQASRQWNKRFDDEIKNIPMLQSVKTYLGKYFAMKDLGEAAYILGIKIYRDRSKRLIGLCQSAYIKKILRRYCMENSKRESILMQEKLKLSKSQANESGITKGARHFRAKVHYLQEVIELGDIKLEKVHTDDN
nr:hypothetical protein [Tanacetum cinerariifolium]